MVVRARIVLLASAGYNHSDVAGALGISLDMARLWRNRYLSLQAIAELSVPERLEDGPRAGRNARISPEQVCALIALACEPPADSGRALSQWSGSELADEAIKRGLVDTMSARHASRLLTRGL